MAFAAASGCAHRAIALAAVLVLSGPAAADGLEGDPRADWNDEVAGRVQQCGLSTRIPAYVEEYARGVGGTGALRLRIEAVHAPGGGMWSGPKWIELSGVLRDDGRDVASFRARRASLGGPFAPFMDTCAILNRCARALGRDIAAWLAEPSDHARLGDLP